MALVPAGHALTAPLGLYQMLPCKMRGDQLKGNGCTFSRIGDKLTIEWHLYRWCL